MTPDSERVARGVFVKKLNEGFTDLGLNIDTELCINPNTASGIFGKICFYVRLWFAVFKKFRSPETTVIYFHFPTLTALPLFFFCPPSNKTPKVVFNFHGSDVFPKAMITKLLFTCLARRPTATWAVVAPSSYFQSEVKKAFPNLRAQKWIVSPSAGINSTIFYPRSRLDSDAWSDSLYTIGYVSALERSKGINLFVTAAIDLVGRGLKCRFAVIGSGSELKRVQREVSAAGFEEFFDWTPAVEQEELGAYFRQMDLFVLPTLHKESLALVGLEALACGVPVIATGRAGPATYVSTGVNGYLFDVGTVSSLVSAVENWMSLSVTQKQSMATAAVASVMPFESGRVVRTLCESMGLLLE